MMTVTMLMLVLMPMLMMGKMVMVKVTSLSRADSVRPRRRQPTRLPGPWDFPGKDTGVGCRFLLQCMKVKSESEVAQSVSDSS